MQLNYLAFVVPFFLFFIGLEYYVSKKKGKNFFHYAESVANLNVGIAERLLDVFATGIFFYLFHYIHTHYSLFNIGANLWTWVILFLLTDLVWYWYHRFAHEINIFWAVHAVHHQSEDFNYTVSARITVFQAMVRSMFWCILPLIGFPAVMISSLLLIHGLYPFFIHTQTIGKLGWLEYIFVTPSHHRVHHASDAEYLDKNYGDVLIIWDKIFGTFKEEKATPQYGLTKQLGSHSFLWQHFHFPMEIWLGFWHARGIKAKWKILFGKPDDLDPRFRCLLERKLLNVKPAQQPASIAMKQYINAQTVFSLSLLFFTILFEKHFSGWQSILLSSFIIISLINSGAMLDQRSWIFYLEFARFLIVLIAIGTFYKNNWLISLLVIIVSLSIYYFRPIQKRYLKVLYQQR